MTNPKEVSGYKLTPNGLEGFIWPLNRDQLVTFNDSLQTRSVCYLRDQESSDVFIEKNIQIANVFFLMKLLSLYNAKLCLAINQSDQNIGLTKETIDDLSTKTLSINDQYLRILESGFRSQVRKKNFLFESLRNNLATYIRDDGFIRKNIDKIDLQNSIITTGVGELSSVYMKIIGKVGYQVKISEFYINHKKYSLEQKRERLDNYNKNKYYINYRRMIIAWFKEYNCELSKEEQELSFTWLENFLIVIENYRKTLENNRDLIPNTLWMNSAGIVWNKLLAIYVREKGGKVVTFDHAYGGLMDMKQFRPLIELQDTDIFVTYSEVQAEYIKGSFTDQLYNKTPPLVINCYN